MAEWNTGVVARSFFDILLTNMKANSEITLLNIQLFCGAILWRLIEALVSKGLSYLGHILELFSKIKAFLTNSLSTEQKNTWKIILKISTVIWV